jgi:hypothetical protein
MANFSSHAALPLPFALFRWLGRVMILRPPLVLGAPRCPPPAPPYLPRTRVEFGPLSSGRRGDGDAPADAAVMPSGAVIGGVIAAAIAPGGHGVFGSYSVDKSS